MRHLFLPVLGAAFVLAGCVTTTYKEPPSGTATAKLRINHNQPDTFSLVINSVDGERCKRGAFMGYVSGGKTPDAQRVGMLDSRPVGQGTMERVIPAHQKFSVSYLAIPKMNAGEIAGMIAGAAAYSAATGTPASAAGAHAGNTHAREGRKPAVCPMPIFAPEPGGEYELTFDTPPGGCSVTLTRLSQDGAGKVVRTTVVPSGMLRPALVTGASCKDT